jgi:putative hemolysin
MLTLALVSIIFAVLFSGFFSGAEIAFFSLSEARMQSLLRQKRKGVNLAVKLKANPDRLLTTILIGNNLVNIGASALVTYAFTQAMGSSGVGLATGIMTLTILTFGEILPKTIATRYAEQIALRSARLLWTLQVALWPVVWFFEQFSKLPRLLLKGGSSRQNITDEDVASMASISYKQGELLDYERDAITNILTLNDTPVSKIMTPKSKMLMIDGSLDLAEVVRLVNNEHYSRIPLYDVKEDRVTGFLFLKDVLNYKRSQWSKITAQEISRKPLEALDTDLAHTLYRSLLKNRTHLFVIYNKKGELVGMATLEDVIEEVLGEIYDETD